MTEERAMTGESKERDYLTWESTVRQRGTELKTVTNRTADDSARDSEAATAMDSEAATADGEGFRCSDGRRRGLQRQLRQTARALEPATADGEGFRCSDGRRRGLQRQRRQTVRTPADTQKTQPSTTKVVRTVKRGVDDGVEIRRCKDFRVWEREDGIERE
ncbi:hypothetical protein Scep_004488 [Stephania cephalantha]|uniref:Uncharacterized protein n=1 Tax=Stephania cephalantha TaxID=152367 RepID=A0AAP0PXC5_9MAGN